MRSTLLLLVWVGCVESQETICSDGSVCPSNLHCDVVHHTCVTPEQLTACEGLTDGADCALPGAVGVCDADICLEQLCGDGLVTGAEDCDGDTTALCTSLGYYDPVPLTCSPRCTFDVSECTGSCGDGVVNGPAGAEACDGGPPESSCIALGYDRGPLTCNSFCAPQLMGCKHLGFLERTSLSGDAITGVYRASATHTFYANYNGMIEDGPNGVRLQPASAMFAMYGFAANDVYAVGAGGLINHFDGTSWVQTAAGAQHHGVWGPNANDVYVVGTGRRIFRNTGSGWTAFDTTGTGAWLAITGWDATQFMVAGHSGRIRRFINGVGEDETTTGCWPTPAVGDAFLGLWGASPSDIYAVGSGGMICHYDGNAWTRQPSGTLENINAVWGRAPDDVYAVGDAHVVLHFDGVEWRPLDIESFASFRAIAAAGNELLIAGDFGEVHDYAGAGFSTTDQNFNGDHFAFAPTPGNEYIATDVELFRWQDAAWQRVLDPSQSLDAVWVSATGIVHAYVASTKLYRFDGTTWSLPETHNFSPYGLAGPSASDLFGFGTGTVGHFDGTTWTQIATTSLQLRDITWVDNTALVVGTDTGKLPHLMTCSSTACTTAALPGTRPVNGIYAVSATNMFTVSDGGEIHHFDGTSWTAMTSGVATALFDIAGTSATDVFAVGAGGVVLHYNGSSWSRVRTSVAHTFTSVAVREDFVLLGASSSQVFTLVRDATW